MDKYLPVGYELKLNDRSGKYIITDVIGIGASTVAYSADHYSIEENYSKHIIKEFNPSYISFQRTSNGEMQFNSSDEHKVKIAKARFVSGCENQMKIRNKIATMNQTPPVEGPFYANNTIYTDVVAYNGTTYDKVYKSLSLLDRMQVCLSAAKLVKCYHDAGYLCLDIKPENIFVIPETKELLYFIDFDSICTKKDISFGNSVSYTKQWAAPEQLNPFYYDDISEKTDVYAIGELIFWSVFERHSETEEHRGFSVYPFENIRYQVCNILTDLFRNTLRSSVNNRFTTMDNVIVLIKDVIDELSKKEYIVRSAIRPKEFFVGRDKELDELDVRLSEEKIVFLYGIGGIGKSEIAKQYACAKLKERKYSDVLYWTFNSDFESTFCQDDNVAVSNVSRVEDESNHSYCRRKLMAIKECLHDNTLIIIDNLNCRLEDVADQEVWEILLSFPCEIIVTTRADQMEHELQISEITDFDVLRMIFAHNCAYDNSQNEYVDEIIRRVNKHTLLIELIAKQTNAAARSPKETLELLEKYGIYGTGTETIGMIKDGHRSRETVLNHMRSIFSMAYMSPEQQLILTKAAFIPEIGVPSSDFCAYYRIKDKNDLNWLIENGWIYRSQDEEHILSVHPAIAEVVIEELKNAPDLQEKFFDDAGISLSEQYLKNANKKNHVRLTLCIADKTVKSEISSRAAAIYLIRYSDAFNVYGNADTLMKQLKYAISVLEKSIPDQKYSAILEYAYLRYISFVETQVSVNDAIDLCRIHLSKVKKAKDFYLTGGYYYFMSKMLRKKLPQNQDFDFKGLILPIKELILSTIYLFKCYYYYWGKVDRDLKSKTPKLINKEKLLSKMDYDYLAKRKSAFIANLSLGYASLYENAEKFYENIEQFKFKNYEIKCLQLAINMRRRLVYDRVLRPTENSIEIVIDEARILYLEQKYTEAQSKLMQIVDMFNSQKLLPMVSSYRVHQFLGNIAATIGNYKTAVTELKLCLDIGKELQLPENFLIKTEIGRLLNETGNKLEAMKYNLSVLDDFIKLDDNYKKNYWGNIYFNLATIHKINGEFDDAIYLYSIAINDYNECDINIESINSVTLGKARCYRKMYEINYELGHFDKAKANFQKAKEEYLDSLGKNHPEVVDFLSQESRFDMITNSEK